MALVLLTHRELSLLLFAFALFLIADNFASPPSLSSASALAFHLGDFSANTLLRSRKPTFRKDGRRASQFVDPLEVDILGDWDIELRKQHDLAPYGVTEDTQHFFWESGDIPRSKLVAHVPGTLFVSLLHLLCPLLLFLNRVHGHR